MALDLYEIDKSGSNPIEKDYSIAIVKDQKTVFGFSLPQRYIDRIVSDYNKGYLGLNNKTKIDRKNFAIRVHTSLLIIILKKVTQKREILNECKFLICNDIDGHFHEIKHRIFEHLKSTMPTLDKINILQQKFTKDSLVNTAAKAFREKNIDLTCKYNNCNISYDELFSYIKKERH